MKNHFKEMLSSSPVLIPPDLDKEFFFGVMHARMGLELFWNKLARMV